MASKTIIATRMELLATKKRIKLATKGHKLLKEKRDALISEFFKVIEEVKTLRKEIEEQLSVAFKALIVSQAVSGISEIRRAADTAKEINEIKRSHKTIMGIKVPVFSWESTKTKVTERGYSVVTASVSLDTAAEKFELVLNSLVKVAEQEAAVKKLAEEIKKTKRKVNALERILIPRLEEQKVYVTMRLEEMEREAFGRLKLIKKRITS